MDLDKFEQYRGEAYTCTRCRDWRSDDSDIPCRSCNRDKWRRWLMEQLAAGVAVRARGAAARVVPPWTVGLDGADWHQPCEDAERCPLVLVQLEDGAAEWVSLDSVEIVSGAHSGGEGASNP